LPLAEICPKNNFKCTFGKSSKSCYIWFSCNLLTGTEVRLVIWPRMPFQRRATPTWPSTTPRLSDRRGWPNASSRILERCWSMLTQKSLIWKRILGKNPQKKVETILREDENNPGLKLKKLPSRYVAVIPFSYNF